MPTRHIEIPKPSEEEIKKGRKNLNLKFISVLLSGITLFATNLLILQISENNKTISNFFFGPKGPHGGDDTTIYFPIVIGSLFLIYFFIYFAVLKIIKSAIYKNKK